MTPQHDITIEKAILGAILLESDAIYSAMTIIKPDCFYDSNNKLIYAQILKLKNDNKKIDLLTVTKLLRDINKLDQVGGAWYISNLTSNIGSALHIQEHCRILYEYFLKRETLNILTKSSTEIDKHTDIFDIYNGIGAQLSNLFELSLSSDYHEMTHVINERLDEVAKIKPNDKNMVGIHTGFSKLDTLTNGFQPADYIIIGARPSMGKTIISLIIAKAAILQSNKKVLFFSLEMDKKRIADRLISIDNDIDSRKIACGKLEDHEWERIYNKSNRFDDKFFIIDVSGLTIEDIKARAITLNRKFGIDEIIIDYIQLIKHSFPTRNTNDNVTHISKNIKALGKDIGCPIVALSQLKRNDNGRQPVLSDLRDSGSLEQDADIVWLLHRDDYEGQQCDESMVNVIQNIIAKNRNGSIGIFETYRNDIWSCIGEIPYNELQSMSMPFDNFSGIEPQTDNVF